MKPCLFPVLLVTLTLTSCSVRQRGLEPVNQKFMFTNSRSVWRLESLQPTLEWKPFVQREATYDLIIYTAIVVADFYTKGKEVYYRENISGTRHTVEQSLMPDVVYVWSVRTRLGTNISAWSTYSYKTGYRTVLPLEDAYEGKNLWWRFRTPKK